MKHDYFIDKSRELRRNMTEAEKLIWRKLRNKSLGVKFWRQYVFDNKYIVDFYCSSPRLVVEIDGGQHSDNENDKIRDEYLRQTGCKIIRLWNNGVLGNLDGCLAVIKKEIDS